MMENLEIAVGEDLLNGADAIAEFLFGSRTLRRRIYHLTEQNKLPTFRLGQTVCARKSVLRAWIATQEAKALAGEGA
jgi:hypothetical protein